MTAILPIEYETGALVYTKVAWADDWTEQPLLEALTIVDQAAPGHSSSTLRWRYGKTIQPQVGTRRPDRELTPIARGDFLGNYIAIHLGEMIWHGVIQDCSDERHGTLSRIYANADDIPSGIQIYTAFGLTWFLDMCKPVTQSRVKQSGGNILIDRAIPFNGGTDGSKRSNRVSSRNYDQTEKVFTDRDNSDPPWAWTAANAIEYLLEEFPPKDSEGNVIIPFELHDTALNYLTYDLPYTDYAGMSPWQIINKIIDRRRGLGWHAIVEDDAVLLVVWSQNAEEITLPSGGTIPANENQVTYDFDDAANILGASASSTLLTRYDQVLVMGERAGSVFTVSPESNMEADWAEADVTTYNEAAIDLTGYDDLSTADKQAANEDRRAADDLSKVFSWHRLRKDWDGYAHVQTGDPYYAIAQIDNDGEFDVDVKADVIRSGLRFEKFIPLRPSVDYVTDPITPTTTDADADESDYLAPILLLQADAIRATDDDGWVHCERLNQAGQANSSKRPFEFSVDLSVREDAPSLIMRTVGVPQHYIAQDLFEANGSFEEIPSGEGIDVTSWLATVYVLHDQFCRAQWPLDAELPTLDLVRQLLIRVADAHLDFILPQTVVGVWGGELQTTEDGGLLRDDREKLKDIARMAFEWYGQTRKILSLSFRKLTSGFNVGDLVTTIGSGTQEETINTCITSVSYDLTSGVMQINTQFGELDFTA